MNVFPSRSTILAALALALSGGAQAMVNATVANQVPNTQCVKADFASSFSYPAPTQTIVVATGQRVALKKEVWDGSYFTWTAFRNANCTAPVKSGVLYAPYTPGKTTKWTAVLQ